jgi:hypothetical protein
LIVGTAIEAKERVSHPTDGKLGTYLIESLIENEFDVTRTNKLPEGRRNGTIGHAFYYVYRRLMHNEVIPDEPGRLRALLSHGNWQRLRHGLRGVDLSPANSPN